MTNGGEAESRPRAVAVPAASSEVGAQLDKTLLGIQHEARAGRLAKVMDWLGSAELGDELGGDITEGDGLGGASCTAMPGSSADVRILSRRQEEDVPARPAAAPDFPQLVRPPRSEGFDRNCCAGLEGLDWLVGDAAGPEAPENDEEEEWRARQLKTGAAGRMVVYEFGDDPRSDVLLRGGGLRRIVVTAITHGGKAFLNGVKAGDVLVSIDGRKDFRGKSADEVHRGLQAPMVLVFLGFVGKLHAEVRLNCQELPCGFSSREQVVVGEAPIQVMDEVVFQPTAPLFIAAQPPPGRPSPSFGLLASGPQKTAPPVPQVGRQVSPTVAGAGLSHTTQDIVPSPCDAGSPEAMYELGTQDARRLVHGALLTSSFPSSAGGSDSVVTRTITRIVSPPPLPAAGRAPFPNGPTALSFPKGPSLAPPTPGVPLNNPFHV